MNTSPRVITNEKLTSDELISWMQENGISDKELSEIFGVSIQGVRLWISGQRDVSITNSRLVKMFIKYPQLLKEF